MTTQVGPKVVGKIELPVSERINLQAYLTPQAYETRGRDIAAKNTQAWLVRRAVAAPAIKAESERVGHALSNDEYISFRNTQVTALKAAPKCFEPTANVRVCTSRYEEELREQFRGKVNVTLLEVEQAIIKLEQSDPNAPRSGLEADGDALVECSEKSPTCVGSFLPQQWDRSKGKGGNFTTFTTPNNKERGTVKVVCPRCCEAINSPIHRHNNIVSALQAKSLDERQERLVAKLDEETRKGYLATGFKKTVPFTCREEAERMAANFARGAQERQQRNDYGQRALENASGFKPGNDRGGFRRGRNEAVPQRRRGHSWREDTRQVYGSDD